jgi:hypothetical protein
MLTVSCDSPSSSSLIKYHHKQSGAKNFLAKEKALYKSIWRGYFFQIHIHQVVIQAWSASSIVYSKSCDIHSLLTLIFASLLVLSMTSILYQARFINKIAVSQYTVTFQFTIYIQLIACVGDNQISCQACITIRSCSAFLIHLGIAHDSKKSFETILSVS